MHLRISPRESTLVRGQSAQHGSLGVHKQRRAVLLGQSLQSQFFAKKHAIMA